MKTWHRFTLKREFPGIIIDLDFGSYLYMY